MTIPLLSYPPSAQNQRVANYEVPGEEQPMIDRWYDEMVPIADDLYDEQYSLCF